MKFIQEQEQLQAYSHHGINAWHTLPHRQTVNVQYYIDSFQHHLRPALCWSSRITGTQAILAAQQCPISYSVDHPRPVAVLELGGTASSSVSSRHESM
jgi:hypothetical protein